MGTTRHSAPPAPAGPQARRAAAGGRNWYIDEIVVVTFAIFGVAGAVFLPLRYTIEPIITSFLLATGLAALTYRFLGGIQGASFTVGSLKLGGALAALVGIAMLINHFIITETPPPQPLHQAYHVTGTVVDSDGNVVKDLGVGDFIVSPPGINPGFNGNFAVTFSNGLDFYGKPQFPSLSISHGSLASDTITLQPPAPGNLEIPLGTIHLHKVPGSPPGQALAPASSNTQTASLTPAPERMP